METIKTRRTVIGILVLMLLTAVPAGGAGRYWNGIAGDNNWFNGANWSNGWQEPQADDDLTVSEKYHPVVNNFWATDNDGSITLEGGTLDHPRVTFNNGLTFGRFGVGNLTITKGTLTSAVSTDTCFGYNSGSSGVANISGGSSTLNVGTLYVGRYGNGTINLSSGGTVDSGATYLGYYSGTNAGTINASGANTLLSTGAITVGNMGEGILRVRANASAESTTAYIGQSSDGEGLVSIGNTSDGVGAEWTTSGTLYLGYYGTGRMTISPGSLFNEGSVVTNQEICMGYASSGIGIASVNGRGSRWTSTGNATVGRLGIGEITISNEALMEVQSDMIIGHSTGSTGSVEVSDSNSTLDVTGTLAVGIWGEGTLTIQDGSDAQTGDLRIGTSAGSGLGGDGEVHVNGTGSTLSAANINLGNSYASGASALLRIDQGSVQASGDVNLRDGGSVEVNSGGLDIDGDISMESSGTRNLSVTYGTLSAGGVQLDWDDFVFAGNSYLNVYGNRSGSGKLRRIAGGSGVMSFLNGQRVTLSDGANLSDTGDLNMKFTDLYVLENSTVNIDGEIDLDLGVDFRVQGGSTINTGSLTTGGAGSSITMLLDTNATVNVTNDMVIADQSGAATSTVDVKSTATLNVGGLLTVAKNDFVEMNINGTVTSGSGRIAKETGTSAVVNVAGSSASWAMTGDFSAGYYGSAYMTISDGAVVSNQIGHLARYGGIGDADSHLFVEGSGSVWRNRGALTLGSIENGGPQGVLTVNQAGLLESAGMFAWHGSVTITGGGSHWENDGDLTLGLTGENHTLDILDGATATITGDAALAAQYIYTFNTSTMMSTMTIDGSGSQMDISGDLEIGQHNWAEVDVQNSGVLTSGNTRVAVNSPNPSFDSSAHGHITVTGSGSRWDLGTLELGVVGDGYSDIDAVLNITQGGVVNSGDTVIGVESDGKGKVVLENSGSTWNTGTLDIGLAGSGVLEMSNGTQLFSGDVYLGRESSGDGTATISGPSTLWDATTSPGNFAVGWAGSGELTISNGADVRNTSATIGQSGQGTVSISGGGSTWSITNSLMMAAHGDSAALNITNGAEVTVGGDFGVGTGGEVTLNNASLIIGELYTYGTSYDGIITWGTGLLKVTGNDGFALDGSGPFGYALTLDTAKTLEVINKTHIDTFNTLTIDNGLLKTGSLDIDGTLNWVRGTVEVTGSGGLAIGDTSDAFATLAVTSGQTLNVSHNLAVGSGGTFEVDGGVVSSNSLSIANGGVVGINRGIFSTDGVSNYGSLVFTNGVSARLQADLVENRCSGTISGSGRLDVGWMFTNQQGGEIRQGEGDDLRISADFSINAGDIRLLGGSLEFVSALENQASGFITGRGTLITQSIDNAGMMAFSGGYTDIFGDVNNTNSIVTSGGGTTTFYDDVAHSGVEIRTSAGCSAIFFGALSGDGDFTGSGTVYIEGDLRPGNSPGVMSFAGDVVFGSGMQLEAELGGTTPGTEYDILDVAGNLTLDGTMNVVLYNGFDPDRGDTFDLLNWGGDLNGQFDAVNLPSLSGDLAWYTDALYITGAITVIPEPATASLLLLGAAAILRRRKR